MSHTHTHKEFVMMKAINLADRVAQLLMASLSHLFATHVARYRQMIACECTLLPKSLTAVTQPQHPHANDCQGDLQTSSQNMLV